MLKDVTEEKDLGVTFDPSLKFSLHVGKITAKANSILGLLKRNFHHLDEKSLVLLYKTLVRPKLEYCSTVWNHLLNKDKDKLEKVQRRATKLVKSVRHLNYSERLKALKIPTLQFRRKRSDMIQVFRIMHQFDNLQEEHFFSRTKCSRTRGHSLKLYKLKCRKTLRKNSFSQRIINVWNGLPGDVVESTTINRFKSGLEKWWKDAPDKYDDNPNQRKPWIGTTV